MTNEKNKHRKLAHEILGLIGISGFVAILLFCVLTTMAAAIAEEYCFYNDITMTEFDWMDVDRWIFGVGTILSACVFSALFLSMLNDRIAYIRTITRGIDALREGQQELSIPRKGNNELTELADSINFMSAAQRKLREKEQALAQEKDQLIRTLSHDIRTPLTSILAYSDYLAAKEKIQPEEERAYLQMIRKKAEQIRQLTDILLDGSKRNPERFENARLLMEQLAAEFEEGLEDGFQIVTELSGCVAFSGSFDVQELRRIFDNLSSNVQKYADPARPVCLRVDFQDGKLLIRQNNGIRQTASQPESYQIGLNSIRRIAQLYGGQVTVQEDSGQFSVLITLSEF